MILDFISEKRNNEARSHVINLLRTMSCEIAN